MMFSYEYEKLGRRGYEDYVSIMKNANGDIKVPTKEEYEAEIVASIEHGIKVAKARHMISTLQSMQMENIDLLMKVYDAVAPILDLKSEEEIEKDYMTYHKKSYLNSLIRTRRELKKEYEKQKENKDGFAWQTYAEVMKMTFKIKELREDLKGE